MQSIGNPNNRAAIFNGQLPPIGNPAVAGRIALARAMQQNPVQVGPQGPQAAPAQPSAPPLTPYNPQTIGALQAPQTGPVSHPLEALARALMPVAGNYQQGQNMVAERGQKEAQMLALSQAVAASRGGDPAGAMNTPNLTPEMAAVLAGQAIKPPEKVADYTIGNQRFSGTTNQVLATGAPEPPRADEVKREVGNETWTVARDGRGSESLISAAPRWQPAEPPKAEQRRIITENGINYYADTGEPVLPNAPAQAAKPALDAQQVLAQGNTLRDDYTRESANFADREQSYDTLRSASSAGNAAGDLSMIYAFMKINDPGGRVTDSDYDVATRQGGLARFVESLLAQARNGRLSETTRGEMLKTADSLMSGAKRNQLQTDLQYSDRAASQIGEGRVRDVVPNRVAGPDQLTVQQINAMTRDDLANLPREALSEEQRKAAADRWEATAVSRVPR